MQITKRRLKEIIKEELKTFALNEELSTKGQQVVNAMMSLEDDERATVLRMFQLGQSTEN